MRITWHSYSYYPYERILATKEAAALLGTRQFREVDGGFEVVGASHQEAAERLTYFAGASNGRGVEPTVQAQLERVARNGKKKQATRYSVHGLHEYKGKFNPQVVRALLNIFKIRPGQRVIDPFCGSGTTLIECAHLGVQGVGVDINPLATMIARAKLQALGTPNSRLVTMSGRLANRLRRPKAPSTPAPDSPREQYLARWFAPEVLDQMEHVRDAVARIAGDLGPVFLAVASNLLRDYSQQDPNDLRTRRRKSPLPTKPFIEAFLDAVCRTTKQMESAQEVLGTQVPQSDVLLGDVTKIPASAMAGLFDAGVTSPPYAMALPYIDTQRLSLVWLGLCQPEQVRQLESELIGSREFRGKARHDLLRGLEDNAHNIPSVQHELCFRLHRALSEGDGFRRRAVPLLLYRYFVAMKASFRAVKSVMRRGAPLAMIVGHNRTTIGGRSHEIDTPAHLMSLASSEGWNVEEDIPLQTYQRYGYHMNNAVAAESLIVIRKP